MNDLTPDYTPPPRYRLLGQALIPLRDTLARRLASPLPAGEPVAEPMKWFPMQAERWQRHLKDGHRHVERICSEVLDNEHAGEAETQRAVGRFEAWVEAMLDDWDTVRGAWLSAGLGEFQSLFAAALRHNLVEISAWLDQLIPVLIDPISELRRRGLPLQGHVTLNLTLKLTGAPELADLTERISQASILAEKVLARRRQAHTRPTKTSRGGFLDIVFGAALGSFLADIFDDD
ncbi:MAG: hypothetical protein N3C63_08585 [Rhodocyclaceae bacterium]|nr:hypothetical protein [Rhodocyclaceae bacterium]